MQEPNCTVLAVPCSGVSSLVNTILATQIVLRKHASLLPRTHTHEKYFSSGMA